MVQQLCQVLQCRTLFSTHYHFLVDQFVGNSRVQLGHMVGVWLGHVVGCGPVTDGRVLGLNIVMFIVLTQACLVEEEGGEEAITFLYKFTKGACPKSYGFNVAHLAGLPASVIALARSKATTCEQEAQSVRLLRCVILCYYRHCMKVTFWQENSTAQCEKSRPEETTINTELHLIQKKIIIISHHFIYSFFFFFKQTCPRCCRIDSGY